MTSIGTTPLCCRARDVVRAEGSRKPVRARHGPATVTGEVEGPCGAGPEAPPRGPSGAERDALELREREASELLDVALTARDAQRR